MEKNRSIRFSRAIVCAQFFLGLGCHLFFALPYVKRVQGLNRLDPRRRYLFAINHVSLLDSIAVGALCWRRGCYPLLVLGDKKTWHASLIKRWFSSCNGFLLERGRVNPDRLRQLQEFSRASRDFHLVVYPEGTRGDGIHVARCQPGLYYIAQEARIPIVPVFISNMQLVSTKTGRFHPWSGLRKVEICFGPPIAPEDFLGLDRNEFSDFIRGSLTALAPRQSIEYSRPLPAPF